MPLHTWFPVPLNIFFVFLNVFCIAAALLRTPHITVAMWVRSFSDASILWSYDVRQWHLPLPATKKLKEWLHALFDKICNICQRMFQSDSERKKRLTHLLSLQWCLCNLRFDHRTLFEALCVWLSTDTFFTGRSCEPHAAFKLGTPSWRLTSFKGIRLSMVMDRLMFGILRNTKQWREGIFRGSGMRRRSHHLWRKPRLKPSSSDRCKI